MRSQTRFLAAGFGGVDDAALGSLIESGADLAENFDRFVFLAGFDGGEVALLDRLEAVLDAGVASVAACTLARATFG